MKKMFLPKYLFLTTYSLAKKRSIISANIFPLFHSSSS